MVLLMIYDFLETVIFYPNIEHCDLFAKLKYTITKTYCNVNITIKKTYPSSTKIFARNNIYYKFCRFCQVNYSYPNKFRYHIRLHSAFKKFACFRCKKYFRTQAGLEAHKSRHYKLMYKCKPCTKLFLNFHKFKRHLDSFHLHRPKYVCKLCAKEFMNVSDLSNHSHTTLDTYSFECYVCKQRISSSTNLILHRKIHQNKKRNQCHLCKTDFNTKLALEKHIEEHWSTLEYNEPDVSEESMNTNFRYYSYSSSNGSSE